MRIKDCEIELMKKYELYEDEAKQLIKAYTKNNNGNWDIIIIEKEIEKVAKKMIESIVEFDNASEVKHELLECGKDRQYVAIISLLGSREKEIADKYLPSWYAYDVNTWTMTFYKVAQAKLKEMLDGGIEKYREFEEDCLYGDTNKVASLFNMEEEFASLIVKEGNKEDLEKFMSTMYITKDGNWKRRICPKRLVSKIFDKIKEAQDENPEDLEIPFERDRIMKDLTSIYSCVEFTEEQRSEIEDLYLKSYFTGKLRGHFDNFVYSKMDDKYEAIKKYIELCNEDEGNKFEVFAIEKSSFELKRKVQEKYDEFIKILRQEKELTPSRIEQIRDELGLDEELCLSTSTDGTKEFCKTEMLNKTIMQNIDVKIDGKEYRELINIANENSRKIAEKKLEEAAKKGIGNIRLASSYTRERNYQVELAEQKGLNVVGTEGKEQDSLYIVSGKKHRDYMVKDERGYKPYYMKVVVPYYVMGENGLYTTIEKIEMNDEQIAEFNNAKEFPEVKSHSYQYGKIDGYYNSKVYDFIVEGEQYHVKDADWSNGGRYTVAWKDQDIDHPESAIGITCSHSEWARNQFGVDEEFLIFLISQNPRRFSKFIEENKKDENCCGHFSLNHIDDLLEEIMQMPTEDELERKEIEEIYGLPEEVEEIYELAQEKEELEEKAEKSIELLQEFENLAKQKGNKIGDE